MPYSQEVFDRTVYKKCLVSNTRIVPRSS